jgi:hypothetical protein
MSFFSMNDPVKNWHWNSDLFQVRHTLFEQALNLSLILYLKLDIQGGPDSIRQFLIINNQSIQQHTGKLESTFCCR